MDYPNLEFLTDIELALLQSEARKLADQDFVNAILIELGKRQKNNES
jgi:hypothetical protein